MKKDSICYKCKNWINCEGFFKYMSVSFCSGFQLSNLIPEEKKDAEVKNVPEKNINNPMV
jgi:hypothetical protein